MGPVVAGSLPLLSILALRDDISGDSIILYLPLADL